MKTKTILFLTILSAVLFFVPSFCNAASETVSDYEGLKSAVEGEGPVEITLEDDIDLDEPIEFNDKTVTIYGEGHTISTSKKLGDEKWPKSGNATLLTAGSENAKLILNNVILKNSPKYGAQAYNGGTLVLSKVTISDCGYGGVITNAGIVEIQDLRLGKNGSTANVGIEIAKSASLENDNEPKILMNGVLDSDQTDNVIYLAVNDALATFDVSNSDTTTDKIYVSGNTVVVTDAKNNVKFVSNKNYKEGLTFEGSEFVPNITVSVRILYKTVETQIMSNNTISMEEINSLINLDELGYSDYNLDGFYADPDFTETFDFETPLTEDTVIYAKLSAKVSDQPEKDDTPKTGVQSYLGLSFALLGVAVLSIVALKKRDF